MVVGRVSISFQLMYIEYCMVGEIVHGGKLWISFIHCGQLRSKLHRKLADYDYVSLLWGTTFDKNGVVMSTAELLDCFIGLQLTFTITERNSSMPAAGLVKYGPDLVLRQQWRRPGDGTAWWWQRGHCPLASSGTPTIQGRHFGLNISTIYDYSVCWFPEFWKFA